jgi:hypothetical protein
LRQLCAKSVQQAASLLMMSPDSQALSLFCARLWFAGHNNSISSDSLFAGTSEM